MSSTILILAKLFENKSVNLKPFISSWNVICIYFCCHGFHIFPESVTSNGNPWWPKLIIYMYMIGTYIVIIRFHQRKGVLLTKVTCHSRHGTRKIPPCSLFNGCKCPTNAKIFAKQLICNQQSTNFHYLCVCMCVCVGILGI